jgi:hypothetical protein
MIVKNIRRKIFAISTIVIILFIVGCSSQLPEIKKIDKVSNIYENNLRVNIKKVYAWINLMPGDKPRFHITGSVELFEDSKYELENVKIRKMNIIQSGNIIYNINPTVEEEITGNKKVFTFSTIRGLLYTSILEREKSIDVELLFDDSAADFKYLIPNIKMEEVH